MNVTKMATFQLLESLKARAGVQSDYALARDVLKVDPGSLKEMRERGLSEERALQFATMLGLDPGPILASIRAERAKDPKVKKAWEGVAKSLKSVAALLTVAVAAYVSQRLGFAPDDGLMMLAAGFTGITPGIHYAQFMVLALLAVILGGLVRSWRPVLDSRFAALAAVAVFTLANGTGYALTPMG